MILTDREIQAAIRHGQICIDPSPAADAYSSTSLDLTLYSSVRIWKKPEAGVEQTIDPSHLDYNYKDVVNKHADEQRIPASGHTMGPGDFLLAWTAESIRLPEQYRIAARVEGKSSLARLGIGVHVTAPTIQSGFSGPLQLEMHNIGPLSVKLKTGMKICQLIFELTFGTPEKAYRGQFFEQSQH